MEKEISSVYEEVENLLKERKQYETNIKELEAQIKENNKEVRQINKDLKTLEENTVEATTLQTRKEEIAEKQKEIQSKIPELQTVFDTTYQKAIKTIRGKLKGHAPEENELVEDLENALIATHEEEKNKLLEIQTKIEGLEKLNRAEMPDSFRERLQTQIKELTANKQAIQDSFITRRETIQLKIDEMRKQEKPLEVEEDENILDEIMQAIKEDDWKQAEKLWTPIRKEVEKNKKEASINQEETTNFAKETENITEVQAEETTKAVVEEMENVQEIENTGTDTDNVLETVETTETPQEIEATPVIEPVQTIVAETQEKPTTENTQKISAVFIDMVSEKIYADIGQNDGNEYNFEMEMTHSMLNKETTIAIVRNHISNFDRIITEREKGQASEKAEQDYGRYIDLLAKTDPFVIAVLQKNHEDLRQYLKAVKNHNKEEMPCELYYNLQKITQTEFEETEQDEIIENVEQNAYLATQVRGLKKAKRARNWRKFENKHTILRAIMRWLRMEENVKQITDGK